MAVELELELNDLVSCLFSAETRLWSEQFNSLCLRARQCSSSSLSSRGGSNMSRSFIGERDIIEQYSMMIVRKGGTMEEVHNYFAGLSPMRSVVDTQPQLPGTMFRAIQAEKPKRIWNSFLVRRTTPPRHRDRELSRKDEDVYKHALLCAQCLLLCGPDAPPTVSPLTVRSKERKSSSKFRALDIADFSSTGHGYDSPDNISIEQEALFSLLRNAFGINMRIHKKLLTEIRELTSHAGGRAKLLQKDLWDHRLKIEYNDHKFYKARAFTNVDCYARWRQNEIYRTDQLIEKVTGFKPTSVSQGEGRLVSIDGHEQYEILQDKLFRQEMKTRKEVANDNDNYIVSPSVISTASKRLLKEFALRFGVGVSYRKITEFACMARNFELSNWFMRCTVQALDELMNLINAEHEYIVSTELQMLRMVLEELHNNLEYIFIKIKSLCPKILRFTGVSTMVEILGMVLDAKIVLGLWDEERLSLADLLQEYVKTAVRKEYTRCREIGVAENNLPPADETISPRLLRRLLQDLRDIMKYFLLLDKESAAFSEHVNLKRVVAKTLYEMFMQDVKELCVERTTEISTETVDVEMLTLAYRISQLDQDWATYVPCREQKWRTYYVLESRVIMTSVADYINKIVKTCMLNDTWRKIVCDSVESGSIPEETQNEAEQQSPASFIPSVRSAFSSVGNQAVKGVETKCRINSDSAHEADKDEDFLYTETTIVSSNSIELSGDGDTSSLDEEVAKYSLPPKVPWKPTHSRVVGESRSECKTTDLSNIKRHPTSYQSDSALTSKRNRKSAILPVTASNQYNVGVSATESLLVRSKSLSALREEILYSTKNLVCTKDDITIRYGSNLYRKDFYGVEECVNSQPTCQGADSSTTFPSEKCSHNTRRRLHKSKSAPLLPLSKGPSRCHTKALSQLSETPESSLLSSETQIEVSVPKAESPNLLDSILPGCKIKCYFTSSVIDLLVAIKRFCSVAGDLVFLLIPPLEAETDGQDLMAMRFQLKNEFYDRFMRAVADILITYAQGMLTLDLCGIGRKVISTRHQRELVRQQNHGLILGCRHEPRRRYFSDSGKEFCPTFQRIKKFFPAEWEPVTVEMCNRINNLWSIKEILLPIQNLGKGILHVSDEMFDDNSNPADHLCSELQHCKEQLNHFLIVLVNCLAFRTFTMYSALLESLFLLDLPCVKYVKRRRASFGDQMQPVHQFIASKAQMFKKELSRHCAMLVTKELWRMIMEDLNRRISGLSDRWIDATYKAKEFLIMIPLLLKAVDVFDEKTFSELLVEKSQALLFRVELYTLPSMRLSEIYDMLDGMNDIQNEPLSSDEIVLYLKRKLPGSFSGRAFIEALLRDKVWLYTVAESCCSLTSIDDRWTACYFGRHLLQLQVLECKEIPEEKRQVQGEAFVPTQVSRCPTMVVGGKRMAIPRLHSEESLLSVGSDTRPLSSLSLLEEEDTALQLHDSDDSEYVFVNHRSWHRNMVARLRELIRQNPTALETFKADIRNVLQFRCLTKKDAEARSVLMEIDPDFRFPRPISCPCV